MPEAPFTGSHMLADLHGCTRLNDVEHIRNALLNTVKAAGATLLDLKIHHFGPEGGVTGVALLAESHISIHTWPERDYAAVDIFLCGATHDLDGALSRLKRDLGAVRAATRIIRRGYGCNPSD
jgi:S-adenosylmethionine decarboxylase